MDESEKENLILAPDCWMDAPTENIMNAFCKTTRYWYLARNVICAISGGADSDIMLDMVHKIDRLNKVRYVFFDTGLEMQATKDHIRFLEIKYNISIDVEKPKKPIPVACRDYGHPFLSKRVAEMIERLQRHNFSWTDEPLDVLLERYPNCKTAVRWWCNGFGERSRFNIRNHRLLKEFMIEHPPKFKISSKCCDYAKKKPALSYSQKVKADLALIGVRQAEGGIRSTTYKSCFHHSIKYGDRHFPVFWFDAFDKTEYARFFGVTHSAAYTVYGCKRTGCAACPFGSEFEQELEMLKKYEPNLYNAALNIFGDSIEYTRAYRTFKSEHGRTKKVNVQNAGHTLSQTEPMLSA